MTLDIRYSRQADILIATASGVLDKKSDQIADRAMAAECSRQGCRKILIDFRAVEGTLQHVDYYQGGTSLDERGFTRDVLIAFLDRREFVHANQFYETVATNRGFRMRHFYEFEDALGWLNSQDG